jgi:putative ABC transport system substrate-binding protein
VRRRAFLAALGGAIALPFAARAQSPGKLPVVGFLRSSTEAGFAHLVAAFRQGLSEVGYAEGRNIEIEFRWGDNDRARVSALANELVRSHVNAIVCNYGAMAAVAAATKTVPVVFVSGEDPVTGGLVANLYQPGGNVTGVTFFDIPLSAKRLQLLSELLPKAQSFALLLEPNFVGAQAELQHLEDAARAIGRQIRVFKAATEAEIDHAFASIARASVDALLVGGGPFFIRQRRQIVALATRHGVPAIYVLREFVEAGGLASYGASQTDAYRRAASYVSRILKGEQPGHLPVELPAKFELVINRQAARALNIEIPTKLLFTADEVIE